MRLSVFSVMGQMLALRNRDDIHRSYAKRCTMSPLVVSLPHLLAFPPMSGWPELTTAFPLGIDLLSPQHLSRLRNAGFNPDELLGYLLTGSERRAVADHQIRLRRCALAERCLRAGSLSAAEVAQSSNADQLAHFADALREEAVRTVWFTAGSALHTAAHEAGELARLSRMAERCTDSPLMFSHMLHVELLAGWHYYDLLDQCYARLRARLPHHHLPNADSVEYGAPHSTPPQGDASHDNHDNH